MLTLLHIVVAALAGGVLSTLAAAATLRMQATWIPRFVSFAVGATPAIIGRSRRSIDGNDIGAMRLIEPYGR